MPGPRPKLKPKQVQLVASGDLRLSANQKCWPAQQEMEAAPRPRGRRRRLQARARASVQERPSSHGFIASQKRRDARSSASIDPDAPLIVAEAVWQYSHHVLPG